MIIISPAKKLNIFPENFDSESSNPVFISQSDQLVSALKKINIKKLKNLMKISDSLAQLNYQRFADFNTLDNISKPAVFLFSGGTFNGLSIRTFSDDMLSFAQKKLRILSGLYGLLKPLDEIQPYRLEMGTNTNNLLGESLYDFWKEKITSSINIELNKSNSNFLFNLSSAEYFDSIDLSVLQGKVINFDFKKRKQNKLVGVGMMIKKYRGKMARFIISNKIEDLNKLKTFNEDGFTFESFDESTNKLLFISK